jgi:hypothetical protein
LAPLPGPALVTKNVMPAGPGGCEAQLASNANPATATAMLRILGFIVRSSSRVRGGRDTRTRHSWGNPPIASTAGDSLLFRPMIIRQDDLTGPEIRALLEEHLRPHA